MRTELERLELALADAGFNYDGAERWSRSNEYDSIKVYCREPSRVKIEFCDATGTGHPVIKQVWDSHLGFAFELRRESQSVRDELLAFYVEWLNDFITIAGIADYHGITQDEAERRIAEGQMFYSQQV